MGSGHPWKVPGFQGLTDAPYAQNSSHHPRFLGNLRHHSLGLPDPFSVPLRHQGPQIQPISHSLMGYVDGG